MGFYHTFSIIPGEMVDGNSNTCPDFPRHGSCDPTGRANMFDGTPLAAEVIRVAVVSWSQLCFSGTFYPPAHLFQGELT